MRFQAWDSVSQGHEWYQGRGIRTVVNNDRVGSEGMGFTAPRLHGGRL